MRNPSVLVSLYVGGNMTNKYPYLELEDQPVDPEAQRFADRFFRYLGMAAFVFLLVVVLPWWLSTH